MRHLVFLLEEPSAQDALQAWLPGWLPADVQPHYLVFQGKQDLERRMVMRMRHWLLPETRFVVLRDQDSGDCKTVKAGLAQRCAEAGRPDAVVRVACRVAGVNYLGCPATTILAGGGRGVLVSVVELDDAVGGLLRGFGGERSEPCLNQSSGSGGQVTNPAGAVHRPDLWAGDLSTAGASWLSLWLARRLACLPGAPV